MTLELLLQYVLIASIALIIDIANHHTLLFPNMKLFIEDSKEAKGKNVGGDEKKPGPGSVPRGKLLGKVNVVKVGEQKTPKTLQTKASKGET